MLFLHVDSLYNDDLHDDEVSVFVKQSVSFGWLKSDDSMSKCSSSSNDIKYSVLLLSTVSPRPPFLSDEGSCFPPNTNFLFFYMSLVVLSLLSCSYT